MPCAPTCLPRGLVLTSIQYVKQEEQIQTENGKEARATRLITERASRRIGQMAFEIANARSRKVGFTNIENKCTFNEIYSI